jgi:hypothetical protein
MAARSVTCTIINNSLYNFMYIPARTTMEHGEITPTKPVQSVPAGATMTFEIESQGMLTGCEGHFFWSIGTPGGTQGEFGMFLDNPFDGQNSFNVWLEVPPCPVTWTPTGYTHNNDNEANITYTFT